MSDSDFQSILPQYPAPSWLPNPPTHKTRHNPRPTPRRPLPIPLRTGHRHELELNRLRGLMDEVFGGKIASLLR